MRIYVKVIAGSSQNKVEKLGEGDYKVWVNQPREKGRANEAVCAVLADYFDMPKSLVNIVGGKTTSRKIVDVGVGEI